MQRRSILGEGTVELDLRLARLPDVMRALADERGIAIVAGRIRG